MIQNKFAVFGLRLNLSTRGVTKTMEFGSFSKAMKIQGIDSLTLDKRKEHVKCMNGSNPFVFERKVRHSR